MYPRRSDRQLRRQTDSGLTTTEIVEGVCRAPALRHGEGDWGIVFERQDPVTVGGSNGAQDLRDPDVGPTFAKRDVVATSPAPGVEPLPVGVKQIRRERSDWHRRLADSLWLPVAAQRAVELDNGERRLEAISPSGTDQLLGGVCTDDAVAAQVAFNTVVAALGI